MSRIHTFPILGKMIYQLDSDVRKYGWQGAGRRLIKRTNTKLTAFGADEKLHKTLSSEPVILVANHPFDAETIALIASLPDRKDAYLVVNAMFTGLSPAIDEHLIPVHIRHHVQHENRRPWIGEFLERFHRTQAFPPEIEHEKNIESIKRASGIINKGGLVIIYPGRRSETGRWFDGIGYLVKGVKNRKSKIVFVYTTGTSNLDPLRLLPFIGKLMPEVKVYFSRSVSLGKFSDTKPKNIREILENEYEIWSSNTGKYYRI